MNRLFRFIIGSGVKASGAMEQRSGDCPTCNNPLNIPTAEDKAEWRETRLLKRLCPVCGERKLGKLVVRQGTRGRWFRYFFGNWDADRVRYCVLHRYGYVPEPIRKGKITLPLIFHYIKMKIQGEFNGLQELSKMR